MVDLNLGNVDERETQRSERANSRELPRGKVCHTQGWTELCQGKKKTKKTPKKQKTCPLSCSPQTQTPGREKIPARERRRATPEGPPGGLRTR